MPDLLGAPDRARKARAARRPRGIRLPGLVRSKGRARAVAFREGPNGPAGGPPRLLALLATGLVAIALGLAVPLLSAHGPPIQATSSGSGAFTPPPAGALFASPSPSNGPRGPSVPGILGSADRLETRGGGVLLAMGSAAARLSRDGGRSWTVPTRPGLLAMGWTAQQPWIAGGAGLGVSADGGRTWNPPQTAPFGPSPYTPLLVSPYDAGVWFLLHGGALLRTRDGGVSWRDLVDAGTLTNPVIIPGGARDRFYLASGSRVLELIDNGQQIRPLPSLPGGVRAADLALVASNPSAILMAKGSDGKIYLSHGTGWTAAGLPLQGPIAAITNTVALVGDGGGKLGVAGALQYSADGGATWSAARGLPGDQTVEAIAAAPDAAVVYAYCSGGDVYSSTDRGRTWSLRSSALRAPAPARTG
ncbi:MAG: WD40/YVTN/BNR-like repeat-containing protein [Candidatus Dormibacteraceae bacterium]